FRLAAETAVDVRAEVAVVVIELVSPREPRRRAGPRRVLPLRLGRQAVRVVLAGFPVEPADERLRVVPAHADDRPRAASPVLIIRVAFAVRQGRERRLDCDAVAPPVAHACSPFVPSDGRRRPRERTLERDLLLDLVVASHRVVRRRAHDERAGRQHDHLRAVTTLLERLTGRPLLALRRRAGGSAGLRKQRTGCERQRERGRTNTITNRHRRSPLPGPAPWRDSPASPLTVARSPTSQKAADLDEARCRRLRRSRLAPRHEIE